jgi:hypothetical protein
MEANTNASLEEQHRHLHCRENVKSSEENVFEGPHKMDRISGNLNEVDHGSLNVEVFKKF